MAAAGGHNLLLIGPPGEGKSLLASAMPGILPRLNDAEKVQLTRIYSASGALEKDGQAVTRRPMRSIHHTASKQSIVGGGTARAGLTGYGTDVHSLRLTIAFGAGVGGRV